MKKYLLLYTFFIFALTAFAPKHPIHLSITEVHFKNEEMQFAHKIFIDDLERVLRKNHPDKKFNLATDAELQNAPDYIYEYLSERVNVKINKDELSIDYIGLEYETNVVWVYGIVKLSDQDRSMATLSVQNTILMDIFEDQRNLMYLYKGEQEKFLSFEGTDRKHEFDF